MRVVHVAPTQFGGRGLLGGGERYPLELARAMAGDVECELITFGPAESLHREPSGLTVRVLPYRWLIGSHPARPVSPALVRMLGWALDADVIHTHQLYSTPSKVAAFVGRTRGVRLVNTDHGLAGGDWYGLLPRLFDRFLPVSDWSARSLRLPTDKTRIVYGGADPVRFTPGIGGERSGVLFIGRVTPHKGVDRLIAAMPPGVQLTIAGSVGHDPAPPERDYPDLLRRVAAGKDVRFIGPVAEAGLAELYRRAAVYVLPSVGRTCYGRSVAVSELLGLSLIEAMACGTPVVASRIGGLPEVVRDGETGFLVTPGDVAGLRERVGQLLADRQLARRLGERAREVVLSRFTWRACAGRCLAAYAEIV